MSLFRGADAAPWPLRWFAISLLPGVYLGIPVVIGHVGLGAYYPGGLISNLSAAWLLAAGLLLLAMGLHALGSRIVNLIGLMAFHAAFLARVADLGLRDFHGQGFSREFFYHFQWSALRIALQEYSRVAGCTLLFMALFTWGWIHFSRTKAGPPLSRAGMLAALGSGLMVLTALAAVPLGHFPLQGFARQLMAYHLTPSPTSYRAADPALLAHYGIQFIAQRSNEIEAAAAPDPPNLITIYLESVNLAFTRRGGATDPGITPNLDRLMAQHTALENHLGTEGFTIAGLMSSMCGVSPLLNKGNNSLIAENGRYAELPCLTDILRRAGYHQVFVGGAGKTFAGKADFLQFHGYDEIFGWEEWIRDPRYRETHSPWGIHDHDLFEEAYQAVLRLEAKAPYHLTMLTLNTHLPGYHSDQCLPPPGNDPFLNGLYCTDRALGRFLEKLGQGGHLARTVVAIVADHPLFNNPQTRTLLDSRISDPRIVGILMDPANRLPRRISHATASFDLAPTLLELLGVDHNGDFIQGRSLLGQRNQEQNFIARDFFVHQGRVGRNSVDDACGSQEAQLTGTFPPSACEWMQALAVMDAYAAQFHRCQATTVCAMLAGGEISAAGATLDTAIVLSAGDELRRFAQGGAPLDFADRQGMLVLVVGAEGTVQERRFFELCAQDRAGWDFSRLLEGLVPDQALLLATRGRTVGCLDNELRQLLTEFGLSLPENIPDSASLAFAGRRDADPGQAQQAMNLQGGPVTLTLTAGACQTLFAANP
jgi:hypothetical protein